ncbi:MAG: phosphotransferase [Lachnospiraceae bacterium]
MNERNVGLFEHYDVTVLRSYRGRGSIICETENGLKILKEFSGKEERVNAIGKVLTALKEKGFPVESYLPTREGNYICQDYEQKKYVVKDYFEGRECQPDDIDDLQKAFCYLGRFQNVAQQICNEPAAESCFLGEMEKKNRELRRVRKFLRYKNNRTDFELFLLKNFDFFFEKALEVENRQREEKLLVNKTICHGDFQYHNILFTGQGLILINFEKLQYDDVSRDLALFMRKVLEKCGWDMGIAAILYKSYIEAHSMTKEEFQIFIERMTYPEKFRKIVNHYINSKKTVESEKDMEKLARILEQEPAKEKCISFLKSFGV